MREKLYCGYVYRGEPDVGGRHDPVKWFKWRTELLRELRAVSTLGDNTEAAKLAMEAVCELNNIEMAVIDVKGLRN